jgi:hypothetical protein
MSNWDPAFLALLDKWLIIEVPVQSNFDDATNQEYNEYLDWLEVTTGEQEMPEDFSY